MAMDTVALQLTSASELKALLERHREFVDSGGRAGDCLDLSGREVHGGDFRKMSLAAISGARAAKFIACDFSRADCYGVSFSDSVFEDCNFAGAQLGKCEFWSTNHLRSRFDGAKLTDAEFQDGELVASSFRDVDFKGGMMTDCTITDTVFDNADFTNAAVSGNRETGTSWQGVVGLTQRAAAVTVASLALAAGATGLRDAAVENYFWKWVDRLIDTPLDRVTRLEAELGGRFALASENEYFRTHRLKNTTSGPLALTDVELRHNKTDPAKAILIVDVATDCATKQSVMKRYPNAVPVPPSGRSPSELSYLTQSVPEGKLSFGFASGRSDCVARVVIDRLE